MMNTHLLFLIPLTICLASGYIFKHSAEEMAYLTGIVAVVSLVLSLALAPWQIQLLVLTLVIISTKRLLSLNEKSLELEEKEQRLNAGGVSYELPASLEPATADDLKFKYRGVSYKPTPSTQVTEGEMAFKYRGNPSSVSQPNLELKYRGALVNGANGQYSDLVTEKTSETNSTES